MDRMEEYQCMMQSLEETPAALEFTVQRAQARNKKRRWGRICGIPVASLAGAAAAFVLLVNVSLPFARACGNIPFLKDLASAVALSPSLKAAVEHDFVQPIGQRQTVNGITMTVEYVIVDKKQINIFYSLEDGGHGALTGDPHLTDAGGAQLQAAVSWDSFTSDDGLRKVTVDFTGDQDVPGSINFAFSAWADEPYRTEEAPPEPYGPEESLSGGGSEERPQALAEFSFLLTFDPGYTETGTAYVLDTPIELDGQKYTVAQVEAYPTHLRLELKDDPGNTAWLRDLDFYLEDEAGNRYEPISNGISATGDPDTPFMPSHRLESSYFGDAEHLTVHITGAKWLDKGAEYMELDVAGGTAEHLPQGVSLARAWRSGGNVNVVLAVERRPGGGVDGSVVYDGWIGGDGEHHSIDSIQTGTAFEGEGEYLGAPIPAGCSYYAFTLRDCKWDNVRISVGYSRYGELEEPVAVQVK